MFFSTSPLPFCRQLINNKQLGDIEVAKKPTSGQIEDFLDTLKNLKGSGDIKRKDIIKGISAYRTGMMSKQKIVDELLGTKMSMSDSEYKQGTDLRNLKSMKDTSEAKKKKGGGKVYTSMDKKYGGGIFPRKGNM